MRSEQILPIGTLLQGRYKIEKVRGKGGFGITYCAMDLKMHARVAIKACVREQEQADRMRPRSWDRFGDWTAL